MSDLASRAARFRTALPNLRLEPLHLDSDHFDGAVHVYCRTWQQPVAEAHRFFSRYATAFEDYHGLAGVTEQGVVAMGFGVRSQPGHWWHDRIADHVGSGHPALHNAWALTELAVLDSHRGCGLGAALLHALLERQPYPRTLLSTELSNRNAQRFYQRHGWRVLHPGFAFHTGSAPYMIMAKELARDERGA